MVMVNLCRAPVIKLFGTTIMVFVARKFSLWIVRTEVLKQACAIEQSSQIISFFADTNCESWVIAHSRCLQMA